MTMIQEPNLLAETLNAEFAALSPLERLQSLRDKVKGRIVFTTSLGLEDQMLTHLIFKNNIKIEVVTLDTGRLFPETYHLWQATEEKYGKRIHAKYPKSEALENLIEEQGIDGFYYAKEFRLNCCGIRKIEPLGRALEGASAWVTGLRGDQSQNRLGMAFASYETQKKLIKVNPLLDLSREKIAHFNDDHGVPINALHAKGFLSIGCAPCTRAIQPGEPERAGRWWWEDDTKRECGLHVPDRTTVAEGAGI
ncbi:phosphoadenylyl-sulfate reductase [Aurantimonas sp. 22II-16-19i]|uniref:phosphoadenylyl-sulfate reductase n=1 Tax=Aurantimonas sp. 22II-16-19i TaxID=1317114 RepID=UPI0009F7B60C|nr:phosphoadenylyl-sulfate reductase [Aurantimonas sp. 22II-16-19i]ORE97661.1 phosphoadenylyl-sulfate reductase [Aurantimonas sp. 22II-16-19i]